MISSRSPMRAGSNSTLGKIVGSGLNKTVVPVPREVPIFLTGPVGLPRLKRCCHCWPSRLDVATNSFDNALTTLAPPPCRPPAVL